MGSEHPIHADVRPKASPPRGAFSSDQRQSPVLSSPNRSTAARRGSNASRTATMLYPQFTNLPVGGCPLHPMSKETAVDVPCSTRSSTRDLRLPVLHRINPNTIRRNDPRPRLPRPNLIMARKQLCVKSYILGVLGRNNASR